MNNRNNTTLKDAFTHSKKISCVQKIPVCVRSTLYRAVGHGYGFKEMHMQFKCSLFESAVYGTVIAWHLCSTLVLF